ncbi:streptophobe family protein [Yinghuangia seranimata]|uniref:streptophobe family protein n=1 Tax=Yinghuangia seranimata TaxID=408067 RepID=UPI00248A97DD|nr:streptophobe family protein [Yinghuangia seranimata]MDI2126388.1 streptophobe family protein [Yinghuangia seranimata]
MSWNNPPQPPGPGPGPGAGRGPHGGPGPRGPQGPQGPPRNARPPAAPAVRLFGGLEAWLHAFVAVFASFAAMAATAWLALWLLGAGDLGGGSMPPLVAATIALAVGGKVELKGAENLQTGDNPLGGLIPIDDLSVAEGSGHVDVIMLGVGLVGALVLGWLFLRPLRYRLVIGVNELLAHVARIAVFTVAALGACAVLGTHNLPIGDVVPKVKADELMGIFSLGATAKFTTDTPTTLGFGLLWMVLTLVLALAVSARGPLPRLWLRYRDVVRPPVAGVMAVFLGAVLLAIIGAPFVAAAAPGPKRMIGGMLLAIPNVMWLLLTLGMGVEWKSSGGGAFSFGLPGPLGKLLNESGSKGLPITINRLAELDSRAWWIPVVSGILLLFGGTVMALRSPAQVKLYQHAWRFAVAFAVTAVCAAAIAQIQLKANVDVLGDSVQPGGQVNLHPDYAMTAGLGALWGACAGLLGGAMAAWIRAVRASRNPAPAARQRAVPRPKPAGGYGAAPAPGPGRAPAPGTAPGPAPGPAPGGPGGYAGGPGGFTPRRPSGPGAQPPGGQPGGYPPPPPPGPPPGQR